MGFLFYSYTSFSPNLISIFFGFYLISYIAFSIFYSSRLVYGVPNFYSKSYNFLVFILGSLIISSLWNSNISFLSFNGLLSISDHNSMFEFIILFISLCCMMISHNYVHYQKVFQYEYIAFIIFSIFGLILICYSNDILLLYVVLELQSLAFYLLAAFNWNSDYNVEAGLKYFVLGSFSSCLMLFGFSMVYFVCGTTNLETIKQLAVCSENFNLLLMGVIFILVAFLHKVGAFPYHNWVLDIYEGSLTSVTAFFAIVPKLVLFYLVLKLFFLTFFVENVFWTSIILFSSTFSVFVATFGAIYQKKLKRLLAYSAISHTGFILLAIKTCTLNSINAYIFYNLVYVFINITLFAIVFLSVTSSSFLKYLINWNIAFKRNFAIITLFTLTLFSVAGIPPLTGFFSKLLVFLSLLGSGNIVVTFLIASLSCIGCFYYIRLIKFFFFGNSSKGFWILSISRNVESILIFSTTIILFCLISPNCLLFTSHLLPLFF